MGLGAKLKYGPLFKMIKQFKMAKTDKNRSLNQLSQEQILDERTYPPDQPWLQGRKRRLREVK